MVKFFSFKLFGIRVISSQRGEIATSEQVSAPGKAIIDNALGINNPKTRLVFGHNLYVTNASKKVDNGTVVFGGQSGTGNESIAFIDLADFNSDNSLKFHTTNGAFNPRSMNMARAFEHEFFGHGEQGFGGKRFYEDFHNVPYINTNFRTPAGIPERLKYTDNYAEGGKMFFNPTKGERKALTRKKTRVRVNKY